MRHEVHFDLYKVHYISIHAPLTGCDRYYSEDRATWQNFNPRTPYGMRQDIDIDAFFSDAISIHAPLTGCDKWLVR